MTVEDSQYKMARIIIEAKRQAKKENNEEIEEGQGFYYGVTLNERTYSSRQDKPNFDTKELDGGRYTSVSGFVFNDRPKEGRHPEYPEAIKPDGNERKQEVEWWKKNYGGNLK